MHSPVLFTGGRLNAAFVRSSGTIRRINNDRDVDRKQTVLFKHVTTGVANVCVIADTIVISTGARCSLREI